MNRIVVFLFFFFGLHLFAFAQTRPDSTIVPKDSVIINDSIPARDSIAPVPAIDSFSKMPPKKNEWNWPDSLSFSQQHLNWQLFQRHPYFGFFAPPKTMHESVRVSRGNDLLFYVLIALLLFCAFLRNSFPKYFTDLFRLFFRTTLKQRQLRDQLMQTPLPSLLLNGFFVISTGLYIAFLLQHFELEPLDNFWLMFVYSCLGLSAIYMVKFIGLKLSGWLFKMQEASDSYIFIVFVVNKMIGLFILPFLILLAFTTGNIYTAALTISWCLIGGLLVYRLILAYVLIRNQVKVNPFHFFLYFCAFELAPLLLIYKALMLFFRITA